MDANEGGCVLRFVLAGELWQVSAPAAVAGHVSTAFGHLPAGPPDGSAGPGPRGAAAVSIDITIDAGLPVAPGPGGLDLSGRPIDPLATLARRSGDVVEHATTYAVYRYDEAARRGSLRVRGPQGSALLAGTNTLLRFVAWRAQQRGMVLLHAAAIGRGPAFMLVPARGGAGKSTATAVALGRGLDTLGDDVVLWDPRSDEVFSVYGVLRLTPASLALLGDRLGAAGLSMLGARADGKAVVGPAGAADDQGRCGRRGRWLPAGVLDGVLLVGAQDVPATGPGAAFGAFASSLALQQSLGLGTAEPARQLAALARRARIVGLRRLGDMDAWGAALQEAVDA